jgi:hypothetical protein
MKRVQAFAILNAACFLLHLVPAQLTQLKLLNNQTIGDVSEKYPTLFTPAGITFSIWGLIYLGLIVFCIYHLIKAFSAEENHRANRDVRRMGYLFMLNNLATGAWVLAWVHELLVFSSFLMLMQLGTLLALQIRLGIYNPSNAAASRWCTQFPLSIYFGWICIATVANISAALAGVGWHGFGLRPEVWATVMIALAALITVFVVLNRRNPFVGLVTVWAFYGIVLKHRELQLESSPDVIATAWAGGILVVLAVVFQVYRNMQVPVLHRRANPAA